MAFYHTYRPQSFKDIYITQKEIAKSLIMAFVQSKIAHAYLFTGTHGTGKTSTARILAKAVNCEKFAAVSELKAKDVANLDAMIDTFPVPCGTCDQCVAITQGSSLDVIELDAASNRGIDDIRDLKENIRLLPISARKKIFIIDEVHMLTSEAFNALLKTLEEPPAHVLFVLCTTELDKVPATIQSRCTKLVFKRPSIEQSAQYIRMIAEKESLKIEEKAVMTIARASGGAYRDAAKLLEQLASLDVPITSDLVEQQVVGSVAGSSMRILSFLASRKYQDLLSFIGQLETNGINFSEVIKELIYHSRMIIHAQLNPESSSQEYLQFSKYFDQFTLADFIDHLLKAYAQQKTTPLPSLPLELAILRIMRVSPGVIPAQKAAPTVERVAAKPAIKMEKVEKVVEPVVEEETVAIVSEELAVVAPEPISVPSADSAQPVTLIQLQERWSEVVRLVKKYNASMASLMVKCKPLQLDGKTVIVETPYSFHKDMIESAKNRSIIEQAVFELLGAQVRIKGSLSNTRLTSKQVENVKEVANEDLVAAVQEIFGA